MGIGLVKTSNDAIKLRSSTIALDNSNVITTIPKGTKIEITGPMKTLTDHPFEWYPVRYNSY